MNPNKYIFFLFVSAFFIGCTKTEPGKTPIARLDNKILSLEEIRAQIDTSQELSPVQVQQYVQRWLTEESLYREAISQGLDRSNDIEQKIENIRRQLIINALLDREVYSQQLSNISEQEIRSYYENNLNEFKVINDVALISYALFKNRDAATEFRNLLIKGTAWNSAVTQRASSIVVRLDSSYQTQSSLLPVELWRVASNSGLREPSYPINTANGHYVLIVWRYLKQGQTADISFVEQEIRGRLTVLRRQKLYEQLVQNLRAKHAIEVFVDTVFNSTTGNIDK